MSKKYILHPQWITSRTDGQRLFVSAQRLAELYRVKLNDCYISGSTIFPSPEEKVVHLYPSYDGIYEIGAMNNPVKNIAREYVDFYLSEQPLLRESADVIQSRTEQFLKWLIDRNICIPERGGY